MIVQTEKIMIMEKYFIHSNELHLIDMDKIHQAVERIVDSLDMAAGSTCHFDLYKVVETYFKDLDKRRVLNCLLGFVDTEEELEEKMEGFRNLFFNLFCFLFFIFFYWVKISLPFSNYFCL